MGGARHKTLRGQKYDATYAFGADECTARLDTGDEQAMPTPDRSMRSGPNTVVDFFVLPALALSPGETHRAPHVSFGAVPVNSSWRAAATSCSRISAWVSAGFCWSISAMVPATIGAAIDVPLAPPYRPPAVAR